MKHKKEKIPRVRIKVALLDGVFSEFIRKRAIKDVAGCERCLTPKYDIQKDDGIFPAWKQLQCSHFTGRGSKSVRYDEDNACGLCGACHMYLEHHPIEHVEFFRQRLGDKFVLLLSRTRNLGKIDREAIELYLKEKIKEIE